MKVLVTGCAGFIGFHVAQKLIARGDDVVGFDSVNSYYDPNLKEARLRVIEETTRNSKGRFTFVRANVADQSAVNACFSQAGFDRVIHLAAQAGVRHSIDHPHDYVEANIVGFTNILEACRHGAVPHLTYASTSSVYGASTRMPFSEHEPASHPVQFYAATKRANELMAHAYSCMFALPTTGLRFFTVYGPWGRPDMALFRFTRAILNGEPIKLFNNGRHTRDFTYIDDVVEAVVRASDLIATPDPGWNSNCPDPATSRAPFRIYNVGNSAPVDLIAYVEAIEAVLGRKSKREMLPLQPGDVADTSADTTELLAATRYKPGTSIEVGVRRFVEWYLDHYAKQPSQ